MALDLGQLDLKLRVGGDLQVALRQHAAFVEDQVAGHLAEARPRVGVDDALVHVDAQFGLAGVQRLADGQVIDHVVAAGQRAGGAEARGQAGIDLPQHVAVAQAQARVGACRR